MRMGHLRDDGRKQRLAAALRENLKRRKQQAKGRKDEPEGEAAGHDAPVEEDRADPPKDGAGPHS